MRRLGAEGPLELRLWNPTDRTQPLALVPAQWQAALDVSHLRAAETHALVAWQPDTGLASATQQLTVNRLTSSFPSGRRGSW